ncbi:MAG: hypothetical protein ACLT8C_03565 [Akkermansia muciniphila]
MEPLIHYAYDQARFERFSALCKQAVSPVMRSMLNKPEDVKSMVKILLLQDTLPRQDHRVARWHRECDCTGASY